MNLFVYFLVNIFYSNCTGSERNIEVVLLYEHIFNCTDPKNNDFPHKIELCYDWKMKYEFFPSSLPSKYFLSNSRSRKYEELPENMSKEILNNTKFGAGLVNFLTYDFIFSHPFRSEKRCYKIYAKESIEDEKNDVRHIVMYNLKKLFEMFFDKRLFNVEDYTSEFRREPLLRSVNFRCHFFENYSSCLDSLIELLKYLNCFTLLEDNDDFTKQNTIPAVKENKMTISKFRNSLRRCLDRDLEEIAEKKYLFNLLCSDDSVGSKFYWELNEHLEKRLFKRDVMLPIAVNSQSSFYYASNLHNFIFGMIKKYFLTYSESKYSDTDLKENLLKKFDKQIDGFSKRMIDEILGYEFDNISCMFFPKIIKNYKYSDSKFNFFIELEKVLCDFYNMFQCIMNRINGCDIIYLDPYLYGTTTPKIIKALKFTLPSTFKVRMIFYYNIRDEEFEMESNDYILKDNLVYIFFEKITEFEIEHIKFISTDYAAIKKKFITRSTFPNMDKVMYSTYYETTSSNCSIS